MSKHQHTPYPHYSMIIEWSNEDQAFIVTVPELPGCRTHGATYVEAARQGQDALESWVDSARADGAPLPAPRDFAERVRIEDDLAYEPHATANTGI